MSYTKQNFQDGTVLTAEQLNKIDSSLYDVANKQKKISHIAFVATSATGSILGWEYYYDDGTLEGVYSGDYTQSDLVNLRNNLRNIVEYGGTVGYCEQSYVYSAQVYASDDEDDIVFTTAYSHDSLNHTKRVIITVRYSDPLEWPTVELISA